MWENFLVVGHRGASGYEPENTIRSLEAAFKMRANAVEVDVRVTKDGVPVLMHDETVDRTTNGSGKLRDLTFEEVKSLDAGLGEHVPSLEEALKYVKGKIYLLLEVKEAEALNPSLKLIKEYDMTEDVLVISFLYDLLNSASVRGFNTGLIYVNPYNSILRAKKLGCKAVLPKYPLATSKAIAFAHRLKIKVIPWVVDDPEKALELKRNGADGLATNKPDKIVKALGSVERNT